MPPGQSRRSQRQLERLHEWEAPADLNGPADADRDIARCSLACGELADALSGCADGREKFVQLWKRLFECHALLLDVRLPPLCDSHPVGLCSMLCHWYPDPCRPADGWQLL